MLNESGVPEVNQFVNGLAKRDRSRMITNDQAKS